MNFAPVETVLPSRARNCGRRAGQNLILVIVVEVPKALVQRVLAWRVEKQMPQLSLMAVPWGDFHGNQAPSSTSAPRPRSSGMAQHKDMLKYPMRTLTSYFTQFSRSHGQNIASLLGNLLFASWLWTWMAMTLWVLPMKPTLVFVSTSATMHLVYASDFLQPPLRHL